MGRMLRTAMAGGAVIAFLAFTAGPAAAEERVCRGAIGATTLDDVKVPDRGALRPDRHPGRGVDRVESGARLVARGVRVIGNVQAENHRHVAVVGSRVGGSVQLVQGRTAVMSRNRITGDLQSFENRGTQTFRLNRVGGNLQCKENRPAPRGGGNVVGGNRGGPVPAPVMPAADRRPRRRMWRSHVVR